MRFSKQWLLVIFMLHRVNKENFLIDELALIFPNSSKNNLRKMLTNNRVEVDGVVINKAKIEVSENSIIITKFENLKLSILDKIELPQELRDLNDLYYLDDDNILITLTNYSRKPKAIILKSFSDIIKGNYIDISDKFIGSPYYINKFDDYFWIPEVKNRSRICKYKFDRNELSLDKVVFDFKNHEEANIKRKSMYPL